MFQFSLRQLAGVVLVAAIFVLAFRQDSELAWFAFVFASGVILALVFGGKS